MFRYNYNEKDKKIGLVIIFALFIIVILYGAFYLPLQKRNLIRSGRFTIGTIVKILDRKGSNDPEYEYDVNGVKYNSNEARILQGTYHFTYDLLKKRYFIIFDSSRPTQACLLPLNPVPDSILNAPVFGWSDLPTGESLYVR